MLSDKARPALERWRAERWWRSISPTMRPTASTLADHVRSLVAWLDEAWDERCTETSELVTGFIADLDPAALGDPGSDAYAAAPYAAVAEKLRWREVRALLVSHLAEEIGRRCHEAVRPLLDELERVSLFDHRPAITVGDLPAFDRMCRSMSPAELIPQAYQALVEAIDVRGTGPVDSFLTGLEVTPVDGELQALLEADASESARRLERAVSLRPRPSVVVDLAGVEPVIQMLENEAIDKGVPPWGDPGAASG